MLESEWLASEDPEAMLRLVYENSDHQGITCCRSDRKLRLFSCAVVRVAGINDRGLAAAVDHAERWADGESPTSNEYDVNCPSEIDAARFAAGDGWGDFNSLRRIAQQEKADLLRDIVGNPFRPVARASLTPRQQCDNCCSTGVIPGPPGPTVICPVCKSQPIWLTPTVLMLAKQAYEERPERKCEACKGTGMTPNGTKGAGLCAACGPGHHDHCGSQVSASGTKCGCEVCWGCRICGGTGCTDDGTLDPVTLVALADALEEAGCPSEITEEFRFVTGLSCPKCGDAGFWRSGQEFDHMKKCRKDVCGFVWVPEEVTVKQVKKPHPLLAHLRSPGPHVRGCWAIDCLLGLS